MDSFPTSWLPLHADSNAVSSVDVKALQAELKTGTLFYKNVGCGLLTDNCSDEDSVSDASSVTSANSGLSRKCAALYKTELCATFESEGDCPYDLKCKFAHGRQELRVIPRHPKYKSIPCRSFPQGTCTYGARCNFLHYDN